MGMAGLANCISAASLKAAYCFCLSSAASSALSKPALWANKVCPNAWVSRVGLGGCHNSDALKRCTMAALSRCNWASLGADTITNNCRFSHWFMWFLASATAACCCSCGNRLNTSLWMRNLPCHHKLAKAMAASSNRLAHRTAALLCQFE